MNNEDRLKNNDSSLSGIFKDFCEMNHVQLQDNDFVVNGIRWIAGPEDKPPLHEYGKRRVFSRTEGNWLSMYVSSDLGFVEFLKIWNDFHQILVVAEGEGTLVGEDVKITPTADNHQFVVMARVDISCFKQNRFHKLEIQVMLGKYKKLYLNRYYALVTNFYPFQIAVRDLYVTVDDDVTLLGNDTQKTQVKVIDNNRYMTMDTWFSCFNSFSNMDIDTSVVECEFRYYNKDNELVHHEVCTAEKEDDGVRLIFKDSTAVGFWKEGEYSIQAWMFGKNRATVKIHVGACGETFARIASQVKPEKDATRKLHEMIGLTEVKSAVRQSLNYMKMVDYRRKMGLDDAERVMHMVFTGNPGTGKTTVARLMGQILNEMGVLSSGHLVECNRESLVGNVVGDTEKRTQDYIKQATGGVLFIDEAYSLMDKFSNDFGKRVIDTLMPVLMDTKCNMVVILAGYQDEMKKLLDSNPGLASRFPIKLHFPDYTEAELMQILQLYIDNHRYKMKEKATEKIMQIIHRVVKINNYGAGRFTKTLLQHVVLPNMATRLERAMDAGTVNRDVLSEIYPEDIPGPDEVVTLLGLDAMSGNRMGF